MAGTTTPTNDANARPYTAIEGILNGTVNRGAITDLMGDRSPLRSTHIVASRETLGIADPLGTRQGVARGIGPAMTQRLSRGITLVGPDPVIVAHPDLLALAHGETVGGTQGSPHGMALGQTRLVRNAVGLALLQGFAKGGAHTLGMGLSDTEALALVDPMGPILPHTRLLRDARGMADTRSLAHAMGRVIGQRQALGNPQRLPVADLLGRGQGMGESDGLGMPNRLAVIFTRGNAMGCS